MDWEKPSPELILILEEAAEPFPVIERRKMFGCPAYYINGNMFTGVYGRQLFLRLPPEMRAELQSSLDAKPFAPLAGPDADKLRKGTDLGAGHAYFPAVLITMPS